MSAKRYIIPGEKYQRGQVLLISLMVLVVAMVVGLSVAARTISTLRTTSAEDSSQRAFSAAEAGIERALTASINTTLSGNLVNSSSYTTSTTVLAGNDFLVNGGSFLLKDDTADVWLSDYPDYLNPWNGTLTILWGSSSDVCSSNEANNTMAALEVILLTGSKAAPVLSTYTYDPCGARRGSNSFSGTSGGGIAGGKNLAYSTNIVVSSGLLARIIPLYAGTYIGVRGTNIPAQGTVITSIGTSGGTQRKIVSFRGHPKAPPELFPFVIFSPK